MQGVFVKVGLFDSGIGGFSVLMALARLMPDIDYYYIADHQYAPFGSKTAEDIIARSIMLTESLVSQGVEVIVVACNTATAIAIEQLRLQFSHISFIGIEPYLNVINHHHELLNGRRGVVLSTVATNNSARFKNLQQKLDPHARLNYVGIDGLASLIERWWGAREGNYEDIKDRVRECLLSAVGTKFDFAVLGCTHYPLIDWFIEEVLEVQTFSPSLPVARQCLRILQQRFNYLREESRSGDFFSYCSTQEGEKIWQALRFDQILLPR